MIDEATLQKFYSDVPAALLDRFRNFLHSHTIKRMQVEGIEVPYYACGSGARVLLTFCGGHSTPYTAWETIGRYEDGYLVVVIDVSGFGTVAALSRGIGQILDQEGVARVVLLGQSLAGIIAQIYFKQHPDRVDGMILINTPALKKTDAKPFAFLMLRLMPGFILKALFKKKFRAYYKPALDDPRAEEGCRFGLAHLNDIMANHFTKKKVISLMQMISEFTREGYTRADFPAWQGKALIVASEDDAGFKDLQWLTDNLPNAESEVLPKGLGHLPQLVHRDKIERLIRDFLA